MPNPSRLPSPSRAPTIVNALATISNAEAKGFGNLVMVFLLLMVQTHTLSRGPGIGPAVLCDVARCA
jgi:hypothetical protein